MEKSMLENLGKLGRDKITGFEGIILATSKHLYGCDSYLLVEKLKDGKSAKADFDKGRIEVIGDGITPSDVQTEKTVDTADLGKLGRDKVTGFEGIITAIARELYRGDSYFLTSKVKDGAYQAGRYDKDRIEIIGDGIESSEVQADKPGGEDLSVFFN
jgi:hypothetical protein